MFGAIGIAMGVPRAVGHGCSLGTDAWGESRNTPPPARPPAPATPVDGGAAPVAPPPSGGAAPGPSGEPAPTPTPPTAGYAPDPPPLRTRHQWIVTLVYHEGEVSFRGARQVELAQAVPTARNVGRFALELYVGSELLDRLRFDFPLLGADEFAGLRRPWDAPPTFERHLSTSTAVMIPRSERATRLVLVDRASGRTWSLPFPPDQPLAGPDAGAAPRAPAPSHS